MKRLKHYFPILFLFMGSLTFSCSGGGCETLEEAPAPMPPSQTLENGVQIRITEDGFNTIREILPQFVEGEFGHIAFIPDFWVGDSNHQYGIDFCPLGCGVDISHVDLDFTVQDNVTDSNNIDQCRDGIMADTTCDEIWADVEANIYLSFDIDVIFAGSNISDQCEIDIGFQNDAFEGTIAMGLRTRPEDGYLRLDIDSITDIDIGGLQASMENCIPILEDFLNALILDNIGQYIEMVQAFVGNSIVDFIANNVIIPLLQPTIDSIIPDIGTEGRVNVGSIMTDAGFLGVDSFLEMRMMSGGYVDIKNGGITAGMIVGFNSDADTDTRQETADEFGVKAHSEHARCVPPLTTFDFTQHGLTTVSGVSGASVDRLKTFTKRIITEYDGTMDQAYLRFSDGTPADISIALTQEMLNLTGFHLVNSGALCLTLGTEQSDIVKVGTFSVLIPSMAEIIDRRVGDAPMQLVIRPQNPIEFIIGQGVEGMTPLLDLFLNDFQIDLYPYVNGRYTRALTLALNMHIEMDLEEGLDDQGNVTVMPVLRPVDESRISARILNSDLVREDPAEIEAIFPSIVSMIMPMMTSAMQPIPMPTYEITKMNSQGDYLTWRVVKLEHLEFKPTTANDALLINGNLVSRAPGLKKVDPASRMRFDAQVSSAVTYSPERLRNTLLGKDDARPSVSIDITPADPEAGPYEFQYRLDGSGWYKFRAGTHLELNDLNLFLQGWHTVELRGRKIGAPQTLSLETKTLRFLLDSVAPNLTPFAQDGQVNFGGYDFITKKQDIEYSVKLASGWTPFKKDATILIADAQAAAGKSGLLRVRARDEAGNMSEETIELGNLLPVTVAPAEESGFGCSTSHKGTSSFPLFLIFGLIFAAFRSKKRVARFFPLVAAVALLATLSCDDSSGSTHNNETPSCFDDNDCSGISCPSDEVSLCIASQCECVNDISWGIPGPHSSVAMIGQHAWVSSYNATYGDLMIAKTIPAENSHSTIKPDDWQFIDGVPEGPVVLPTSDVRFGINTPGEDVGAYTSIGGLNTNSPIVAHHNYDTGSMRITLSIDGTNFNSYDVDNGGDPQSADYGNAGLFNDLVIRDSDSNPTVAYMVNNIPGTANLVSEVRFATANVPVPTAPEDWTVVTVASKEYPYPEVDEALGDWPEGTGLFVKQGHFSDGRVAIGWYDQIDGNLKLSWQSEVGGSFGEPVVVVDKSDTGLPMGLFTSFAIDQLDEELVHFVYQDGMQRALYYATYNLGTDETEISIVDDGFREDDGLNQNGLPMPVQHYFGADCSIKVAAQKVFISWQDATTQELLFASLDRSDALAEWEVRILGGNEEPYEGSVGFYLDMTIKGNNLILSTYGVNLHAERDILGNPALYYFVNVYSIPTGIVE